MQKRWYELSPDVCIVISKIELSHEAARIHYAKQILLELQKAGYKVDRQLYLNKIRTYQMRRWYDKNRYLFMAFEYLKDATEDIQHVVIKNIIASMNNNGSVAA
jgi:hypothetical protein